MEKAFTRVYIDSSMNLQRKIEMTRAKMSLIAGRSFGTFSLYRRNSVIVLTY